MNRSFIKSIILKLRRNSERKKETDLELLHMIDEARENIALCRRNYDFVSDDTLVDMYIYSLKAYEMKYKHLLRIAKQRAL